MSARDPLSPARAALLVVDLQEKLLPAIADHERVLRRSLLLMRAAAEIGIPVITTTQYAKGLGPLVAPVREAAAVEPLDKVAFGCFEDAAIRARVDSLGRDQLVVCGIEAHICVTQTVLAALRAGRTVHVATDAVGSRAPADREAGLARMREAGAVTSSAEMAVYELLGRSGTDAFKRILPLLR